MYLNLIEPEFMEGSTELDLPVRPYPGNVAEDCKAAMAPSLASVFQQFNEIFGTGRPAARILPEADGSQGVR